MDLTVEPDAKKLQIALNPPPEPAEKVKCPFLRCTENDALLSDLHARKPKPNPKQLLSMFAAE